MKKPDNHGNAIPMPRVKCSQDEWDRIFGTGLDLDADTEIFLTEAVLMESKKQGRGNSTNPDPAPVKGDPSKRAN